MPRISWNHITQNSSFVVEPRTYVCGFCGDKVGPNIGVMGSITIEGRGFSVWLYICSSCSQPTFFDEDDRQWPGVAYGADVIALPDDVSSVYDEARRCMSVAAYTSASLACRKILVHLAVEKGAEEGLRFVQYVDWLVEHHYVPPGGQGWADVIRQTGNEATHELTLIDEATAQKVLSFVEFLLKFIYELPARVQGEAEPPAPAQPIGHVE